MVLHSVNDRYKHLEMLAAQTRLCCSQSYCFAELMMRCQNQFSSEKQHSSMEAMLFPRFLVWKWQLLNLYVEATNINQDGRCTVLMCCFCRRHTLHQIGEDLHFFKLEKICTSSNWTTSLYSPFMLSLPTQKAQPLWCKDDMLQRCCHSQTNPD